MKTLVISKRVPIWVSPISHFSSAVLVPTLAAGHSDPPTRMAKPSASASDFDLDSVFRFLRNKVHPEMLIRVVDSIPNPSSAVAIFNWASDQKNFRHTAETYEHAVLRLGLSGNSDQMQTLLEEMLKSENYPQHSVDKAVASVITALCTAPNIRRTDCALSVFKATCSMNPNHKPQISACSHLLSSLVAESGNFNNVVFVYKEMVKRDLVPNVETINCLIKCLLETGRVGLAIRQFSNMANKGCVPNTQTFKVLLAGLCSSKEGTELLRLKIASSGLVPNPDLFFHALSQSLCDDEVFDEMAMSMDHRTPSCSLNSLVDGLCQSEKLNQSIGNLQSSSFRSNDNDTFGVMISAVLLDTNRPLKHILSLFSQILVRGSNPDARTYCLLIRGLCGKNMVGEIITLFQKMISDGFFPDSATLDRLISCLSRNSRLHSAAWCLTQMYSKEGMILEEVNNDMIISGLIEEGYKQEACVLLDIMLENGWIPDSHTHSLIVGVGYVTGEVAVGNDNVVGILAEGFS